MKIKEDVEREFNNLGLFYLLFPLQAAGSFGVLLQI